MTNFVQAILIFAKRVKIVTWVSSGHTRSLKKLTKDKHSSLFVPTVIDELKKGFKTL
jgi:hypothetical protein